VLLDEAAGAAGGIKRHGVGAGILGLSLRYGFLARESTERWDSLGSPSLGSRQFLQMNEKYCCAAPADRELA